MLILVFTNEYLHPLKRIIRKRGLFVSSIFVSGLFTTLLTRFTTLAPMLSETPISMTIISITMFQWFLYICVVTLKKCFTLGEMCVISQAAAVVVHGATEYIFTAVMYPTLKSRFILLTHFNHIVVLPGDHPKLFALQ